MGVFEDLRDRIFGGKAGSPDVPQAEFDAILEQMAINQSEFERQGFTKAEAKEAAFAGIQEFQELGPLAETGDTEFAGISTDPALRDAELAALLSLQERADEGLTLQDESNLARIQAQAGAANRGAQGAISQNFAQRGLDSSALEFAAAQQAAQNNAQTQALMGLEIASQSQQQQRAAAQELGQLSGTIQGRDFNQQASEAQAQDAINRFNTGFQNEAAMINQQGQNATNLANLQRQQQNVQFNVGQSNTASQANAAGQNTFNRDALAGRQGIQQTQFNSIADQFNRASLEAQARNDRRASREDAVLGGLIQGGVAFAGGK